METINTARDILIFFKYFSMLYFLLVTKGLTFLDMNSLLRLVYVHIRRWSSLRPSFAMVTFCGFR
ncbi:hypothetical protein DQK91_19750 [Oceanidesulfovibrio marinus]|uniref:Uncharacterized protein n=1 Tax=Oceanidesulfovibrio marinus TaxID=370038 RepID=A0A6P1ZAU0_9BACT|nr:hypothetical protein DQK91_19750 [Oceanidesulfovibrio marinus]